MNKTVKKVTGLLLAAALTAVGLAGCGGQENTTDNNTGNAPSENTAGFEDTSGTLSLAGSTSME